MATIHAYLNFNGNCEKAFEFYQTVFDTESMGVHRYSNIPPFEGMPELSEEEKNQVMHTSIMINESTMLMGSDVMTAFCAQGQDMTLTHGNGTYIMLDASSKEEAKKLYDRLTVNGQIEMPLTETEWAESYASFKDQYGIAWMINFTGNKQFG